MQDKVSAAICSERCPYRQASSHSANPLQSSDQFTLQTTKEPIGTCYALTEEEVHSNVPIQECKHRSRWVKDCRLAMIGEDESCIVFDVCIIIEKNKEERENESTYRNINRPACRIEMVDEASCFQDPKFNRHSSLENSGERNDSTRCLKYADGQEFQMLAW